MYQEKCRICGTALYIKPTYKKCSDCGYIEFPDEYETKETTYERMESNDKRRVGSNIPKD